MTAAGIIALFGFAVTVASLVWLHLQPTKLSSARDPVSEYGITSFRAGYRVATISFAAAGLAVAAGISQALGGRALAVVILLVVFAITRAGISWFPMDPPGAKWTRTGWMHFVLAFAAFASVLAAASVLGAVLSHPRQMARAGSYFHSSGLRNDRLPGPVRPRPDRAPAPSALRGDRARLLPVRDHLVRRVRVRVRRRRRLATLPPHRHRLHPVGRRSGVQGHGHLRITSGFAVTVDVSSAK